MQEHTDNAILQYNYGFVIEGDVIVTKNRAFPTKEVLVRVLVNEVGLIAV